MTLRPRVVADRIVLPIDRIDGRAELQAALAILPFGGLHRVAENDGRREQHRTGDEADGDEGDDHGTEGEDERHDEQRDREAEQQIADAIGDQSPSSDELASGPHGVVTTIRFGGAEIVCGGHESQATVVT